MSLYKILFFFALPVNCIAMALVFIRIYKGPTVFDRIVALDLLITMGIGSIAIYSIITKQPLFLDVAMILALIGFLSTVAFSYYLEKRKKHD
ncbi:MAG TPA: cation:proton antiporter [Edaphocola sp.]|nr:cation:proton antiporter [Edaphocola sp.]